MGCFHLLVTVNAVVMNIWKISVQVSAFISFGYTPRRGIAGSYGNSIFNFSRPVILFSTAAASFYIPISNTQGASFFTHLPTLVIFFLSFNFFIFLDNSHPSGCKSGI